MFNKALFFEQLKRFWAIPALASLAYLLAVYAPVFSGDLWQSIAAQVDIITMGNNIMIFIMALTPIVAAFCVFGCFFNKKTATAFYSFPVNKKQLLATNALVGIILSIIPVIFFCALLLLPTNFHRELQEWHATVSEQNRLTEVFIDYDFSPQGNIPHTLLSPENMVKDAPLNTLPIIAGLFMRMVLATLFYFAVAWLAFSLAGHGLVALLLSAVLPFIPTILFYMVELVGILYVFGYVTLLPEVQSTFIAYSNPAMWETVLRADHLFTQVQALWLPVLIYSVLTLAMLAGAYVISRRRKTERTGNSIMFVPIKNVLVFMLSFLGMLIVGALAYLLNNSVALMHAGFVLGFAIGYVIAQMIAEKSFYVFAKIKFLPHFSAVAAAMYVSMLLITQFGLNFYVNRVPDTGEIFGIYVGHAQDVRHMSIEGKRQAFNSDASAIEDVRSIHQLILSEKSELQTIPRFSRGNFRRFVNGRIFSQEILTIQYLLHDDSVVIREYFLPHTFTAREEVHTILDSEAVVLAPYTVLKMPEFILGLEITYSVPEVNAAADGASIFRIYTDTRFEITDPEQFDEIFEILAAGLVQNAVEARQRTNDWGWRQADHDEMPSQVFVSFRMDWEKMHGQRETGGYWRSPMGGFWRSIFIQGEYADLLIELISD
jgi:hypothetical protein